MDLLRVEHICKTYGSGETAVHALKDVSFSVPKGEFVAIVGESGSGKSTLLNMIGALDTPTSGMVYINEKDTFAMKEKALTTGDISREEALLLAQAPLEELAEAAEALEVEVILTRRNTFGPLHQCPKEAPSYGPGNFMTTGEGWSDAYMLYPQGLLEKPEVRRG